MEDDISTWIDKYNNAKKDSDSNTKLMRAARRGDTEECRRLIASGADVNIQDNDGNTALSSNVGDRSMWEAAYLMMKISREHSNKECKTFLMQQRKNILLNRKGIYI